MSTLKDQRHRASLQLVDILRAMLIANPDKTFSQALSNFDFIKCEEVWPNGGFAENYWVDEYDKDPVDLLERVKLAVWARKELPFKE